MGGDEQIDLALYEAGAEPAGTAPEQTGPDSDGDGIDMAAWFVEIDAIYAGASQS